MSSGIKRLLRRLLPARIQSQLIIGGPLRGLRIVTSWRDYPAAITGQTERRLLDWLAKNARPGETWLDIGTHYGYTAIALCRLVGEGGRVFAFEPMISTAGYVTQTRLLNHLLHLVVLPLGLGAPEQLETRKLSVTRGMVDSTLQKSGGVRMEDQWTETIMVARFDWLWQQICGGHERIDGIKIDVQGMEIEVLQGMIGTLKRQRSKLVIEMHRGVNRKDLLEVIEAAGYSRQPTPIERTRCEEGASLLDDCSYEFHIL